MRNRRGKLDMAHAVAADLLHGHFDTTFLADDALVLHALVLAAEALVVLHRSENPGTEQAVPLRLERAVVDGFGFLDLAMGPAQNLIRTRKRDANPVEGGNFLALLEDVDQFLIHVFSLLLEKSLQIPEADCRRITGSAARHSNRASAFPSPVR